MRVAIDSGPLSGGDSIRGIGVHTRELVNRLKRFRDLKLEVVDFRSTDLAKFDIAHYPYFKPYNITLPFKKPTTKMVVTIHDLTPLIYPNAYPPGVKGRLKFLIQRINLRNIDAVITISETSKKDIIRFLNIPSEKIFVTYLAPQTPKAFKLSKEKISSVKKRLNLPDKFVLYVGDVNYNKNVITLAKACKIAKLKLVIVGKQAALNETNLNVENKPWREFLAKYKTDPDIARIGYLEDEEFEIVFKLASVYCQPSLYEGFGIPLLEAFQRNLPVVSSRTQALVEIGGDACVYFEPHDHRALSTALLTVIGNKKVSTDLISKGISRLKLFSWEKAARETYEVYKSI